ncbi:MAG: amidase [Sulfobacillus acidophilus]|uniref:Amidase n=1 Tax=Sulfobacillus acidophilus TaxID=53633 RepID=A0A2T2WFW4_9FIRM|nr:MAG: amidase [Sulfobacillus acidophilus]
MQYSVNSDVVAQATVSELQTWLDEGQISSADLVLLYLERISRFDRLGPQLNSILEINPDAYHIAQALDQERRARGPRGPLHGIPVVIKDNLSTADKMHTSAGSLALKDLHAPFDAAVVERLRASGAVILGKTNMTEWANFMSDHMKNGYSSRGGQVLNPYGPGTVDPGGSSSGSAAAVAAGLAGFAIGTETSGSILSPASQHSLVGIKPTVGLVSRFGIIPIAVSQDTAGPMCRTVLDAALVLGALTGIDLRDPVTGVSEGRYAVDYTIGLSAQDLHGVRLGVPREAFLNDAAEWQQLLMEQALRDLSQLGATIVDPVDIPSYPQIRDYTVLIYEFKAALNSYLASLGERTRMRSLSDIIAFNQAHEADCLKYGQSLLIQSDATTGTLTEPEYLNARARDLMLSREQGIDRAMSEHQLDALLFFANSGASIAAKAGYPSITVPAGYSADNEPMGLTFTARAFEEAKLIRWAYAYEVSTQHRRPPVLRES